MKVFKKSQPKILIALAVLFAMAFSFVANLKGPYISAKAEEEAFKETEIEELIYKNIAGGGFIGFLLSESDYTTEALIAQDRIDYGTEFLNYMDNVCTFATKFKQNNSNI